VSRNRKLFGEDDDRLSKHVVDYQYSGLYDAFSTIIRREGMMALYTGVGPKVCRASVLAAVEMAMYDVLRDRVAFIMSLHVSSILVHAVTALIASFFSALASNPFDMARSRIMNQPTSNGRGVLYRGPIDCLIKSIKLEGVSALMAGFWAFFYRLGPNTMITFIVMEQLRIFLRRMFP
jgi:Mitochondrial carrier protein